MKSEKYTFPLMRPEAFSIYPIVDSFSWVERLLAAGIKMVQLRIKSKRAGFEKEISDAIACGRRHQACVVINDHWQLAIDHGALVVHLGQDDLNDEALSALSAARIRLGVSSHSEQEIAHALDVNPSYLAIGTVFKSPSKTFSHNPVGTEQLKNLCKLAEIPIVAIGGITLERAPEVLNAGANGIAVISDITAAENPEQRVNEWLCFFEERRTGCKP